MLWIHLHVCLLLDLDTAEGQPSGTCITPSCYQSGEMERSNNSMPPVQLCRSCHMKTSAGLYCSPSVRQKGAQRWPPASLRFEIFPVTGPRTIQVGLPVAGTRSFGLLQKEAPGAGCQDSFKSQYKTGSENGLNSHLPLNLEPLPQARAQFTENRGSSNSTWMSEACKRAFGRERGCTFHAKLYFSVTQHRWTPARRTGG